MGANDLISQLRNDGFSVKAENSQLVIKPAKQLTDDLKKSILQCKQEILGQLKEEEKREARLRYALEILYADPNAKHVVTADTESEENDVILVIAIRGIAVFEMKISKDKYDPFKIMELVQNDPSHQVH